MAFLVSDAAAGSDAVLKMQQNAAAAPNVQTFADESAKQMQLKTQKEAADIKFVEAHTQVMQLQSIVTETGIEVDKQVRDATAALMKDPEWSKKSTSDKAAALGIAVMDKDPGKGAALLKASGDIDLKDANAQARTLENNARVIGQAYSRTADMKPEDIPAALAQMSPEQHAMIEKQLPGFFDEKDPALQQKQLKSLFLGAHGTNLRDQIAHQERMEEMRDKAKADLQRSEDQFKMQLKMIGAMGGGKEAAANTKAELTAFNTYTRNTAKIDYEHKDEMKAADLGVNKAKTEALAGGWFGIGAKESGKLMDDKAYKAAVEERSDLNKMILKKKLDALDVVPESDYKNKTFESLMRQLGSYDEPKEEPTREAKGKVNSAPPPAAAPMKAASGGKYTPDQQTWIDKAKAANPGMSEAQIIEEGKKRKKL